VEVRAVECPILLGRGPLLHIGDTKISRKQGQIEWSADSKWTLVTIRAMLFKKAGDEDNWDRLDGGTSVPLTEGCSIGFLDVQELTFKVSLKPTKVQASDSIPSSSPVKRERVLPAWMTKNSVDKQEGRSSTSKVSRPIDEEGRGEQKVAAATNSEQEGQPSTRLAEEGFFDKHSISDNSEDGNYEQKSEANGEPERQPSTSGASKLAEECASNKSDNNEDQSGEQQPDIAVAKRISCSYGSSCYRKNPQHKVEEAHPGDSDYVDPVAVDDDSDKPECEFGVDCYRKNPQHRRDFSHTSKPRPPKRKAATKRANKKKSKDDDGDDYDSSFIDDEDFSDEQDLTSEEEEEWKPNDDSD